MEADKEHEAPEQPPQTCTTTEYCAKLQQWMWQYYWSYSSWQSWAPTLAFPFFPPPLYSLPPPHIPGSQRVDDNPNWYNYHQSPAASSPLRTSVRTAAPQAGREYSIPSHLQRLLAETVDFFILFCVKATIVLWVMHLMGMKDISKYVTQFIVEEVDEKTSMEDLQKMMVVALVYRFLVCVYETVCIWGAGGATPGKFLLGLRVVTCDSCTLVRPNCVLVIPASNVSFSASAVRALTKNFSIAFLFPIFFTLLFYQHNRTVFDLAAGTIVVQYRGGR